MANEMQRPAEVEIKHHREYAFFIIEMALKNKRRRSFSGED
jgi:hypothetical protein